MEGTTAETIPWAEGYRVRLRRPVDRFPFFIARAGMTGTVIEAATDLVAVRLDEHLPGCEEWDNELVWADASLPDLAEDLEALEYAQHLRQFDALRLSAEADRVAQIPDAYEQRHEIEVEHQRRIAEAVR